MTHRPQLPDEVSAPASVVLRLDARARLIAEEQLRRGQRGSERAFYFDVDRWLDGSLERTER
ncbi:MAG TPA: hypothetical protein VH062_06610 [Polyangiaceae bacterium]|jgi:hypothetical protein|nr:hypothetical protein [Polyangiaceae bacterium]